MKSLLPATIGAPACVAILAAVSGCTDDLPREERELVAMPNLRAVIDVDVGVPQDPFGTPSYATGLSVSLDYPDDTCLSLHDTAHALVDGARAETIVLGGLESVGCAKPAIHAPTPAPRDISTITLADHSAAYDVRVARLFVNPRITLPPALAPGIVIARVDDPRAIASATAWWRSSDGTQGWMKPVDTSTHGELRFMVPSETRGAGTLGITVTIRDNDVSCTGFASCKAIVRGGGAFAVTVDGP